MGKRKESLSSLDHKALDYRSLDLQTSGTGTFAVTGNILFWQPRNPPGLMVHGLKHFKLRDNRTYSWVKYIHISMCDCVHRDEPRILNEIRTSVKLLYTTSSYIQIVCIKNNEFSWNHRAVLNQLLLIHIALIIVATPWI